MPHMPRCTACHRHGLSCSPKQPYETERGWSISSIFKDNQTDFSTLSGMKGEERGTRSHPVPGPSRHPSHPNKPSMAFFVVLDDKYIFYLGPELLSNVKLTQDKDCLTFFPNGMM